MSMNSADNLGASMPGQSAHASFAPEPLCASREAYITYRLKVSGLRYLSADDVAPVAAAVAQRACTA